MKVYLDDTTFIKSDTLQFILVEEKTVQEGKTKGEVVESIVGFYADLTHAIKAYIKERQLNSNATTLHGLLQETKDLREYVEKLVAGYDS